MESNYRTVRTYPKAATTYEAYSEALEEILCLNIDIELSALVLGNIEGRDFGDVLILAFSLFFLELEGDTTDGATLNTLHEMGGVPSNLFQCSC